jgi:hypothetical protein
MQQMFQASQIGAGAVNVRGYSIANIPHPIVLRVQEDTQEVETIA